MKNKRSKNSIYYHSTKKKSRKQEKFHNLHNFNKISRNGLKNNKNNSEKLENNNKNNSRYPQSIGPFLIGGEFGNGGSSQNASSSSSNFSSTNTSSTKSQYKYKTAKPTCPLKYGFTNSQFLCFLAKLKPKEYLVFVSIIAILLTDGLNDSEKKIIYAFISNITDAMQTLIEQEIMLHTYNSVKANNELRAALEIDLLYLQEELDKIKKRLQ